MLSSTFLAQLTRRQLRTRAKGASRGGGSRPSKELGEGLDFADFRAYGPGDATRHIDPNLHARWGQFFVRQYVVERPLHIAIVLDCSASMRAPDAGKFAQALALTQAYAALALGGGDRLSLHMGNRVSKLFSGRGNFSRAAAWLSAQSPTTSMDWRLAAAKTRGASLTIVVSDFLFVEPETVMAAFVSQKAEVWAIQVLTPNEQTLADMALGPLNVEDVETGQRINVNVTPELMARYAQLVSDHNARLAQGVMRLGGQYHCVSSNQDVQRFVLSQSVAP